MDFQFIEKYVPLYVAAGKLTLFIACIGIVLSILIGILASAVLYYRIPLLKRLVSVYVELSRNTPLLVQLFFLYFGLPKMGIRWSSEVCGIIGLSFLGGAYMTESFRAALSTVEKGQLESAKSLGLNPIQILRYVLLPEAITVAIPSIVANMIFLIKETSVFSGIALKDLMYEAKDLIGLYYKTEESLVMLVFAYIILLLPISILGTVLERRVQNGRT